MTRTMGDNQKPEQPISRDGIESWLDVLTSMLSLPASQRTQVRDELEDHLRSRVDDLLLLGKTEQEAIGTAIAELGETAELARTMTSASRSHTSFRRFAMNATFFVLAGSIMTAGISMMMPTNTNLLPQTTTTMIVDNHGSDAHTQNDPFSSFTIDVRSATIADLFNALEENTSKPLIVHWDKLADLGYGRDTPIDIDANQLTAGLVLTILAERTDRDRSESIAVLEEDEHIEIGTRSQFDRRSIEKRIYDLSGFADRTSQAAPSSRARGGVSTAQLQEQRTQIKLTQISDLLQTHISTDDWAQMGGDLASLSVLDTSLIVTAPKRMHAQIDELLTELADQHEAKRYEQLKLNERAMERIRAEYDAARSRYLATTIEVGRVENRANNVMERLSHELLEDKQRHELRTESDNIKLMLKEIRLEQMEHERRYESLQSLLIGAEHDELTNPLSMRTGHPQREQTRAVSQTIAINGPSPVRSGIYQLPASGKLTLSSMLTAANATEIGHMVKLRRDGETTPIGTVGAIINGSITDVTLDSDDEILISVTN